MSSTIHASTNAGETEPLLRKQHSPASLPTNQLHHHNNTHPRCSSCPCKSIPDTSITMSSSSPIPSIAEPRSEKAASPQPGKKIDKGKLVRDAIIGFSDGLTVPFALTAGLSSLGNSKIVIIGGLAELFAGSISMGLGAYLAASTESKHYEVEEIRERAELKANPVEREEQVYAIFDRYGLSREECSGVVAGLKANPDAWVRFTMDVDLKIEKESTLFGMLEGLVMGVAYFVGGLLPMIPYFADSNVNNALFISIGITVAILLVFGYVKALITGCHRKDATISAIQTLTIGALAAGVSYGIVKGVNRIGEP